MRTLVASPEEPRRPVSGSGYTYAGPGFTIAWRSWGSSLVPPTATTNTTSVVHLNQ
jgi:hypothetical protein